MGTSTRKRRGVPSERVVEPMTVKLLGDDVDDDENLESCTEVMMIWGMEYVLWITVMASARVLREVILIPERTLD